MYIFTYCVYIFCSPIVQVSYTRNRHSEINTVITNITSVELILPADDNYIIQICALSDSGDGMPTEPINIHKLSKKPCSYLDRVWICCQVHSLVAKT